MARWVAGFGVKEHYQNRNRLEQSTEEKSDVEWWYSLDELSDEIDFLTVHRLLTNETKKPSELRAFEPIKTSGRAREY